MTTGDESHGDSPRSGVSAGPLSGQPGASTAAAAAVAVAVARAAAMHTPRTAAAAVAVAPSTKGGGDLDDEGAHQLRYRRRLGGGGARAGSSSSSSPVRSAAVGEGREAESSSKLSVLRSAGSGRLTATQDDERFAASQLSRKQAEWDRQMETHDHEQAELYSIQWKLVREQTGTLARELGVVQQQLREVRSDSRQAMMEVEQYVRESQGKISEEHSLRLALSDNMEQCFKKARQDLDAEIKQRLVTDSQVGSKFLTLEEAVSSKGREHRTLEMEVSRLSKSLDVAMEEISVLKDALEQEAGERRTGDDKALDMIRDLRDTVLKDNQERLALQDDQTRGHMAIVEQVRSDQLQAHGLLKDKFATLQKELGPYRDELPSLRARLQELETTIGARLKEHSKGFERDLADKATQHQRLERRVAELAAAAEKDHLAQQTQAEDFEQHLKTCRTKLKNLISEEAESARAAREEMQAQLLDQVEREAAMREAQCATLLEQWSGHRVAFDARVDALEGCVRDVERRHRDARSAEGQDWEAALQRQAEALAKQFREQSEGFQTSLAQERRLREDQHQVTEEQIEFLDRFLQDIREIFLHKGGRTRTRMGGQSHRSREPPLPLTATWERPQTPDSSAIAPVGTA